MEIKECDECGSPVPEADKDNCIWDPISDYYLCEECTDEIDDDIMGSKNT